MSLLLTDRYETHACRWFSEEHSSISPESLERLKTLEEELKNGKSDLMNVTERLNIARMIMNDFCSPHEAVKKFAKDIQQLIKVKTY